MRRPLQYAVIGLTLLGSGAIAIAQQEKTQQNSADEALVRSAPERKDPPPASPGTAPTQASQPGLQEAAMPVFLNGKLDVPGAPQEAQTEPAKFSARNDKVDTMPIMAYPPPLTPEQRQAIYQRVMQGTAQAATSATMDLKPAQQLPASVEFQEFSNDLTAEIPAVSDYKFVRSDDKVLLVNPRERIVMGEIAK